MRTQVGEVLLVYAMIECIQSVLQVKMQYSLDQWFLTTILKAACGSQAPFIYGPHQSFNETSNILCNKPCSAMKQNVSIHLR